MKRQKRIVYWEFSIDILGPRHEKIADRREARKVLSGKRRREIEKAAVRAAEAKLPPGFSVLLS